MGKRRIKHRGIVEDADNFVADVKHKFIKGKKYLEEAFNQIPFTHMPGAAAVGGIGNFLLRKLPVARNFRFKPVKLEAAALEAAKQFSPNLASAVNWYNKLPISFNTPKEEHIKKFNEDIDKCGEQTRQLRLDVKRLEKENMALRKVINGKRALILRDKFINNERVNKIGKLALYKRLK